MSRHDAPTRSDLPTAVLWDMDGTIVDTEPYWMQAEHELVAAHGGVWTDEHALHLVGRDLWFSARYLREHGGVDLPDDTIVETLLAHVVARVNEQVPWCPGARELLVELADAGVPQALVTMSWASLAEAVVAHCPRPFDAVITGDTVSHGKPHPQPYLTALAALGVSALGTVVIEDSPTGVASAQAAGLATIAVPLHVPVDPAPGRWVRTNLVGLTVAEVAAHGRFSGGPVAKA